MGTSWAMVVGVRNTMHAVQFPYAMNGRDENGCRCVGGCGQMSADSNVDSQSLDQIGAKGT